MDEQVANVRGVHAADAAGLAHVPRLNLVPGIKAVQSANSVSDGKLGAGSARLHVASHRRRDAHQMRRTLDSFSRASRDSVLMLW